MLLDECDHLSGYPDPAFPGQLSQEQVQVCQLHPGASSQSAPLHLAAAVGEYPQDAVPGRLMGCHLGCSYVSEN